MDLNDVPVRRYKYIVAPMRSQCGLSALPAVRISVIINNFNYGRFLDSCIESVLASRRYPDEIILVDDGSTDNSLQIAKKYENRIQIIAKRNEGQASTLNVGFERATGDLLFFLDADDVFHPDKLERMVSFINERGGINKQIMAFHPLGLIDKHGFLMPGLVDAPRKISEAINSFEEARSEGFFLWHFSATSGLCITRTLATMIFPLPITRINVCADEFVARAAQLVGSVYRIDDVLGSYRVHGANHYCGRKRVVDEEFMLELEAFLNKRLVAAGKEPVVRFFVSRDAYTFYSDRGDLVKLWKVVFAYMERRSFVVKRRVLFGAIRTSGRLILEKVGMRRERDVM